MCVFAISKYISTFAAILFMLVVLALGYSNTHILLNAQLDRRRFFLKKYFRNIYELVIEEILFLFKNADNAILKNVYHFYKEIHK